jgi:hypothetical protein
MPERTEASMIWPRPENVSKVLHGVHGIFAEISSGTRSRRHSTSLNKERCVDVPVLAIPIGNADLVLHCDASREAIGSALYQRDAGGFLQPRRRFYSRWYHKLTEFPRAFYLGPGGARRDEPGGAPTAAGNSEK